MIKIYVWLDHACHCTDTGYFFDQYHYDTEEQKAASEELQNSLIRKDLEFSINFRLRR